MAADGARSGTDRVAYDDGVVRGFVWATVGWALLATLAGAWTALDLAHPEANLGLALSYGRLRAFHSSAATLAFTGNALFAIVYFVAQRALRTTLAWRVLARVHFASWQLAVVAATAGPLAGITQGREQAEPEWLADALLAVSWACFAGVLFATVARRNVRRLPVALWFVLATALVSFAWHALGNLAIPLDALHSLSFAAGGRDAVVQAWCGQNATAFLLTVPLIGAAYWIVPQVAGAPIWSYRLAIVNFWTLLAAHLFAGVRPLLDTALPDSTLALSSVAGVLLWAPTWAAVVNGFGTLASRWSAIRTDPVARFFAAAFAFLGLGALEGAVLALREVDAVAHYTAWIDGHLHGVALGWTALAVAAALTWMVPALYGRPLYSRRLAALQLYLGVAGTGLYLVASWTAGATQGAMLDAVTPSGELAFPSFLETLRAIRPLYAMRALGGLFQTVGMLAMAYNLLRTAAGARPVRALVPVTPAPLHARPDLVTVLTGPPMVVLALTLALGAGAMLADESGAVMLMVLALGAAIGGGMMVALARTPAWHAQLEERASAMVALVAALIAASLAFGLRPALAMRLSPAQSATVRPASALELAGRAIYVREGCVSCHSQMVRPFAYEALRYGEVSRAVDSRYDRPAQWGDRRTGPDLARVGGRYPAAWHYLHLVDPRRLSPGTVMPSYALLAQRPLDPSRLADTMRAMRTLGVPYTEAQIAGVALSVRTQSDAIVRDLARDEVTASSDREIVALIAYLESLGRRGTP